MRNVVVVWAILIAAATPVAADDFGGWRFAPPANYAATQGTDHVTFQRITAPTFCQIALYRARPMSGTFAAEAASEWTTIVEKQFTPSDVKAAGSGTTKGAITFGATAAAVKDPAGSSFRAILYVVAAPGAVSSVLLLSSTPASITACRPALTGFLDSLAVTAGDAPPPVAAPVAADSVTGRWATSATASDSGEWGSVVRQYTFASDGTYTFHSETWGGKYRSTLYRLITETGTYAVAGDQVTLAPTKASGVEHSGATSKPFKVALEKASYRFQRHYFAGLEEWNLILTPARKTVRDGEFASNDAYPGSYMYSATYQPAWKYAP